MFDPMTAAEDLYDEFESPGKDDAKSEGEGTSVKLATLFSMAYTALKQGLQSFARSVELLNISNGVECSWEVTF